MSEKSKKRSVTTSKLAIDRPFAPAIIARATEVASKYTIMLQPDSDLGYIGRGVEFPYAMDEGRTPDECVRKTRSALVAAVATMLENGELPPPPASENKRTEQINIRLTAEEKLLLEEKARTKGFRGVSDFVRAASLSATR